jgi:hypothetical protein
MPSRVIREGLLDSQRYWSVAIEARQLFWHLMLVADDFGLMSLAPIFIRRRCFVDAPSDEKLDKLIAELHDADLLRVYEVEAARYGFIPRFQQTLRTDKAKCPMPPAQLFQDDRRAVEKFQRNKEIFKQMHSIGTASAQQPQRSRVPEVERRRHGGSARKDQRHPVTARKQTPRGTGSRAWHGPTAG